jgi:hypothetical protein
MANEKAVIEIGSFRFESRRAVAIGKPSREQWRQAFEAAKLMQDSSPFWLGDLAEYAEAHWPDYYRQIAEATGYAVQTVVNAAYVSRHVDPKVRRQDVPFSHHAEVASLPGEQQAKWLKECAEKQLTRAELREKLRDIKPSAPASKDKPLTQRLRDAADTYPFLRTLLLEAAEEIENVRQLTGA